MPDQLATHEGLPEWEHRNRELFERTLQSAAADWFRKKKIRTSKPHPHDLPDRSHWLENIINPTTAEHIKKVVEGRLSHGREGVIKPVLLDDDIHHGLSSQALLFNLIGQIIIGDGLEQFERALEMEDAMLPAKSASMEIGYRVTDLLGEAMTAPTVVDLVLKDDRGRARTFIITKLAERGFEGCAVFARGDCDGRNPARKPETCFLHHIGCTYWTLLDKHGILEGPLLDGPFCPMALHSEFFRVLLLTLEHDGILVFLSDARNPTFICPCWERGLWLLLRELLPKAMQKRLTRLSTDNLSSHLSADFEWFRSFSLKYGMHTIISSPCRPCDCHDATFDPMFSSWPGGTTNDHCIDGG